MDQEISTLDAIQDVVRPLAEKYHLKELYLFGSYARGEATSGYSLSVTVTVFTDLIKEYIDFQKLFLGYLGI